VAVRILTFEQITAVEVLQINKLLNCYGQLRLYETTSTATSVN